MTQDQIRKLEKELWDAADALRANSKLTASEYKDPVLGLVLLRFAQNKYEEKSRFQRRATSRLMMVVTLRYTLRRHSIM